MKRLLILSALLLFSVDVFAEDNDDLGNEPVVCELFYTYNNFGDNKSFVPTSSKRGAYEGIERCKKGDILEIYFKGFPQLRPTFIAKVCNLQTVIALPQNEQVICEYTGRVLEKKDNFKSSDK